MRFWDTSAGDDTLAEDYDLVVWTVTKVEALRVGPAGAALAWSNGSPKDLILHTFGRRLSLAAEREGFRVPGG